MKKLLAFTVMCLMMVTAVSCVGSSNANPTSTITDTITVDTTRTFVFTIDSACQDTLVLDTTLLK